jgi:hypothetical protein
MRLHELLLEFEGNFFRHDKALGRNARLAVILNSRVDRGRDRRFEIGAGHHNERIAAAQFEHNFLDSFRGGNSHLNPGLFASR